MHVVQMPDPNLPFASSSLILQVVTNILQQVERGSIILLHIVN